SLNHAFWLAEEKNSLRDWDKSKWETLYPTRENVEFAIQEKDMALYEIREIRKLSEADCPYIKQDKLQLLRDRLFINEKYVVLYAAATKSLMLARYVIETKESREDSFYKEACASLRTALIELKKLEQELTQFHKTTDYLPHYIYTLLDPDRIHALHKDLNMRTKMYLNNDN
ncbi:MAG: hypothetical protein GX957_05555, partial [Clostridiaceae bacterium]|nr:hypothetical protein [Clostridiaceae bacterium]